MKSCQRSRVLEFVMNHAHILEARWHLLGGPKREDHIQPNRLQRRDWIADEHPAVELDRRLVAAYASTSASRQDGADNSAFSHTKPF